MINPLDIIQESKILKESEFVALSNISDELRKTWETVQVFRTRTEMEVSVLNDAKRPTPDAKYWQAVREQNVMFCELMNLSYEYRKKAVETRRMERDLATLDDEFDAELKGIEIEQNQWQMLNMEKTAHDRIREILEWSAIKNALLPDLKYGVDDVDKHQLEAMGQRFALEASLVNSSTPPADARNILGLADMANKIISGGPNVYQIK